MKPGDLYWVDLPARGGHAQAGRRPAIMVQKAAASDRLATVLVIPLTTQLDALRFPGTVLIEPDAENGLPRASVALGFQLSVIDKRFLGQCLGSLSAEARAATTAALDEVLER